jgi:hypothetical protein
MARRSTLARRTIPDWGIRAVSAVVVAWLGYTSVTQSLAYSLRTSATKLAHDLSPRDGRITAALSIELLQLSATEADRKKAENLARKALQQDPTAVDAVTTLGLISQMRGDRQSAGGLLAYSNTLSRRDLRARLWMIEDAVARENIPGALRNYDIALRTSRRASDILFPVLASAISDPAIQASLVKTLVSNPAWGNYFISYAASAGPDLVADARLFEALTPLRMAMLPEASAQLIDRMIGQQHFAEAWTFYSVINNVADQRRSRDPNFAVKRTASAFDWRVFDGSGISASIQRTTSHSFFDFAAASSVGGPLLRQAQMLPPGNYTIDGRSAGIDQPDESLPYWVLTCTSGRELGRVAVPNSTNNNGRFAGYFTVPSDCPSQYLTLVAQPSGQVAGISGQIEMVKLQPAAA